MSAPSRLLSPRLGQRFRPPRFGLGGSSIGELPATDDGDVTATATIDAAYRAGIRFFATAPGDADGRGEGRFGTALAGHPRGEFVLATKVGGELSAAEMRESLTASLDRLRVPSIDLVFILDPGERSALEVYPALLKLRTKGLVGAIGAAGNDWQALDHFVRDVELDAVVLGGGHYSLLDRSGERLIARCEARGVAAIVSGVLTPEVLWTDRSKAPSEPDVIRARRIAGVCERYGVSLPQVALAFPSLHPAVTSVLIGAASPAEIRADAALVRQPVPAGLWREPELS